MSNFTIFAEYSVKPEDAGKFRELVEVTARASCGEPGCLRYEVLEKPSVPGVFVSYEVYDDELAFSAHAAQAYTQTFLAAVKPILVSQAVTRLTRAVSPVSSSPEPNALQIAQDLGDLNTSLIANVLRGHAPERLVMHGVAAMIPPRPTMVGRARTLRFLPSREDIKPSGDHRRMLIDTIGAGEVLVFDGAAVPHFPLLGDMTALRAVQNKAVGYVTDGFIRDIAAIEEIGLPVFARGTWPSPSSSPPMAWEMDTPIQCGGVLVTPGDWVMGDRDGVMVIPPGLVATVLEKAPLVLKQEEFSRQLLMRGHSLAECYPIPPGLQPYFERWAADGPLPTSEEMASQ